MKLLKGNFNLDIAKAIDNKMVPDKKKKKRYIEGYMTTPMLDLEDEITDPKAYPYAATEINERLDNGSPIPIFIEHRRKEISLPIGRVVKAQAKPNGIWFKGEIADGKIADPVWELIEQGILNGCSMGGDALETAPDYDREKNKDIRRINKMTIRELSLTGLPVNPQAVFSIAKSLNMDGRQVTEKLKKLEKAIELESSVGNFEKAVEEATEAGTPLGEEEGKRIKEALDNLEQLLGLKTEEAPSAAEETKPEEQESEEVKPEEAQESEEGTETVTEEKSTEAPEMMKEILEKINQLLETEKKEEPETTETEEFEDSKQEEGGETETMKKEDKEEKGKKVKEEEKVEKSADNLLCKSCGMKFAKSLDVDYEAKFCPQCGKPFAEEGIGEEAAEDVAEVEELEEELEQVDTSEDFAVAEDEDEEGEDDEDEELDELDEEDWLEMVKFLEDEDENEEEEFEKNIKVLQSKPSKDSGPSVASYKNKEFIPASKGKRTDSADTTMHENPKPNKKLERGVSGEQFDNYGKDRVGKSIDPDKVEELVRKTVQDTVEKVVKSSIEKAIDAATSERKGVVPNQIEKSHEEANTLTDDKLLARALTHGMSDPIALD